MAMSVGEDVEGELLDRVNHWLAEMESLHWQLLSANEMMRCGVRDVSELTSDIDRRSASLVRNILERVNVFFQVRGIGEFDSNFSASGPTSGWWHLKESTNYARNDSIKCSTTTTTSYRRSFSSSR